MSRKPLVVMSPQRLSLRSKSALVVTVVPWMMAATSSNDAAAPSSAASTPADWFAGVDGTLASRTAPVSGSMRIRSVKVPPTSTPTIAPLMKRSCGDGGAGCAAGFHRRERAALALERETGGLDEARPLHRPRFREPGVERLGLRVRGQRPHRDRD